MNESYLERSPSSCTSASVASQATAWITDHVVVPLIPITILWASFISLITSTITTTIIITYVIFSQSITSSSRSNHARQWRACTVHVLGTGLGFLCNDEACYELLGW